MLDELNISKNTENIILIEEKIDFVEYFTYLEVLSYIKDSNLDKKLLETAISDLKNGLIVGQRHKKALLAILSLTKEIKDLRILENFAENGDPKLRTWAKLALADAKAKISMDLTGEETIVIVTGLGGKEDKIRLFGAIYEENYETFDPAVEKFIIGELEYIFEKKGIEIEKIKTGDFWISFLVLFPLQEQMPDEVFGEIIENLQNYNVKISSNYLLNNLYELPDDTISQFLKKGNIKQPLNLPSYNKHEYRFITEWVDEYKIDDEGLNVKKNKKSNLI